MKPHCAPVFFDRLSVRHVKVALALLVTLATGLAYAADDYVPQPGQDPVEPTWKGFADFKDVVHPRQPTARGTLPSVPPR